MNSSLLMNELEKNLKGVSIRNILFTTYSFSPDFFETEILSTFFDVDYSSDDDVRRVQTDFHLKDLEEVAVCYDMNALVGEAGPKLDYRRVAINLGEGNHFHPKVIFVLGSNEQGEDVLLVGAGSTNLTQSGYWSNFECYHFETITLGDRTPFKYGLKKLIEQLEVHTTPENTLKSYSAIKDFLESTKQEDGTFNAFYSGQYDNFPEFLSKKLRSLEGLRAELISPLYTTDHSLKAFKSLYNQLKPKEWNLLIPRAGSTWHMDETIKSAIDTMNESTWLKRPLTFSDLKQENILNKFDNGESHEKRLVHAKYFRFYNGKNKNEVVFCGSVNITDQAFSNRNVEAGFLISQRKTEQLLVDIKSKDLNPTNFLPESDEDKMDESLHNPNIQFVFSWKTNKLTVNNNTSDKITLVVKSPIGIEDSLSIQARDQKTRNDTQAQFQNYFSATSIIEVAIAGNSYTYYIDEIDTLTKPSMMLELSAVQILELWLKTNSKDRDQLLKAQIENLIAQQGGSEEYLVELTKKVRDKGFFSAFSQIFQAFAKKESSIIEDINNDRHRRAANMMFGEGPDSLKALVKMSHAKSNEETALNQYLVTLSTQDLLKNFSKSCKEFYPEFKSKYSKEIKELTAIVNDQLMNKEKLGVSAEFLEWFESHFLTREKIIEVKEVM